MRDGVTDVGGHSWDAADGCGGAPWASQSVNPSEELRESATDGGGRRWWQRWQERHDAFEILRQGGQQTLFGDVGPTASSSAA